MHFSSSELFCFYHGLVCNCVGVAVIFCLTHYFSFFCTWREGKKTLKLPNAVLKDAQLFVYPIKPPPLPPCLSVHVVVQAGFMECPHDLDGVLYLLSVLLCSSSVSLPQDRRTTIRRGPTTIPLTTPPGSRDRSKSSLPASAGRKNPVWLISPTAKIHFRSNLFHLFKCQNINKRNQMNHI